MWRLIPILSIFGFIVLYACAHGQTNYVPVDVATQCLPLVTYSPQDQNEFAAEVSALDSAKNAQVLRFLEDYEAMRNADRACKK